MSEWGMRFLFLLLNGRRSLQLLIDEGVATTGRTQGESLAGCRFSSRCVRQFLPNLQRVLGYGLRGGSLVEYQRPHFLLGLVADGQVDAAAVADQRNRNQ